MKDVTLILPKDRAYLEEKYAEALADIVSEMLTPEELEHLITELKKQ